MNAELKRTLKRAAWLLGIFLVFILIVSAVERKEESRVARMDVSIEPLPGGYLLIDAADVRQLIKRSFGYHLEEQPVGILDVERVERVLEEDPFVLDAEVHIDAKNEVKIEVLQREPVLRIIDDNGLDYYLDSEGMKLPLSKHFTARVLVATGNIPPHSPDFLQRKKHLLKDLFQLAKLILADEFLKSLLEQIYVNQGEFVLIPKVGDQKILLGKFENVEDKLERLNIFYQKGIPYEGWQKYKTINLKFKNQVVCGKV